MKLTKREVFLLCMLAVMLTGVSYYYLYWTPTFENINEVNSRVSAYENEKTQLTTKALLLSAYEKRVVELTAEQDKLPPLQQTHEELLYAIRSMLTRTDSFFVVSFEETQILNESFSIIGMTFNLDTTYDGLVAFLDKMSSMKLHVRIPQLTVTSTGNNMVKGVFKVETLGTLVSLEESGLSYELDGINDPDPFY